MSKCIYKNRLGRAGESAACDLLESKGFRIVKRNYRFERAEIDIVACDDRTKLLLFAEVKTRRNKNFGEPLESVTPAKQANILRAVQGFIYSFPEYSGHDVRIDVVSIMSDGKVFEIEHIENAF
ncbi:MAG: YraN family protein [Ignavibacteria bacterium]|nr:YraN family protein [Ignavibacteria bacterium]